MINAQRTIKYLRKFIVQLRIYLVSLDYFNTGKRRKNLSRIHFFDCFTASFAPRDAFMVVKL